MKFSPDVMGCDKKEITNAADEWCGVVLRPLHQHTVKLAVPAPHRLIGPGVVPGRRAPHGVSHPPDPAVFGLTADPQPVPLPGHPHEPPARPVEGRVRRAFDKILLKRSKRFPTGTPARDGFFSLVGSGCGGGTAEIGATLSCRGDGAAFIGRSMACT